MEAKYFHKSLNLVVHKFDNTNLNSILAQSSSYWNEFYF